MNLSFVECYKNILKSDKCYRKLKKVKIIKIRKVYASNVENFQLKTGYENMNLWE